MRKILIALLIILIFFVLFFPFTFDFATSVVPGWHTTVFPPFYIFGPLIIITILIDFVFYWLAEKKQLMRLKKIVLIHFIISLFILLVIMNSEVWLPKFIFNNENNSILNSVQNLIIFAKVIISLHLVYLIYITTKITKK